MARNVIPAPVRSVVRTWVWSKAADGLAVPRPSDEADQRLDGYDPLEVLLVGSGAATGWGVLSHSLGLAGAFARALRVGTGHGVVLRGRVDPDLTAANVVDVIRSSQTRFDALRVVVLGVNEALATEHPADWRRDIGGVLEALEPSAEHPVVIAGIQPISSIPLYAGGLSPWLDKHVEALNRETAALCAATPHTAFAVLPAPPRADISRYRGPADYRFWAQALAQAAVPLLQQRVERAALNDRDTESGRISELRRLGLVGPRSDFVIDDAVQFARSVFGTESAGIKILDEDRAWFLSSSGTGLTEVERGSSFTSHAIEAPGAFVVEDALEDERFRNFRYVVGPPHIRFFAGYPIDGPSGQRVGVLCVYDSAPREFDDASRELLRELAGQVQSALQRGAA